MKEIIKKAGLFLCLAGASFLHGTPAQVLTAYLGGGSRPIPVRVLNVSFGTAAPSISTGLAFSGTDAYVAITASKTMDKYTICPRRLT